MSTQIRNDEALEALNARFEREDIEDEETAEVSPAERDVVTFAGFADGGVRPRDIDGADFATFGPQE